MPNPGTIILGLSLVGTYTLRDLFHHAVTRNAAFEEARRLSNGKGIINIGCGPHECICPASVYQAQVIAEQPEVLANLDIAPDGVPHFIQLDLERSPLPFADKQFGSAFASHVLEHLDNWSFALEEACRVADYVVVVLPDPIYFSGWLVPQHKQHFSRDDIREMAQLYPNVVVYY